MAKLQPKRLKTSAKKANFPKESLLVRIGVGGHGEKINVYPSLTARPSKFSQRGLPQLERHHQTKQKQYKQMPNTFLAIYFFSLINIVTCGSWGRFAVWLPRGGVQPWESTSTTPACMAQHNHVFHAWGASPSPQHREQRSSHGNFQ